MPFKISALLNPINSIPFVNLNSTAVFIYLSHSQNVFSKWKHKHHGCVIASVISTDHSEPEIPKQHRVDESDFLGKQVLGWTIYQGTCWGFHHWRKSGNAGLDKMRLGLPCGLNGSMGRKRWASVPSPLQVGWRVLSTFDSLLAAGCPGSEPDQARLVSTHGGARRARRTGAPAAGGPIWASSSCREVQPFPGRCGTVRRCGRSCTCFLAGSNGAEDSPGAAVTGSEGPRLLAHLKLRGERRAPRRSGTPQRPAAG